MVFFDATTIVPPDSDPPVMTASAPPRPVTVVTPTLATPLASEHSSTILHRPRGRRRSSHSTPRVIEGPKPTRHDRRTAPEQPPLPMQSSLSQDRRIRAQTFVTPGGDTHSVLRPPNPAQSKAGTRSLASTMRQVLAHNRKFRILVLGKRGSGKSSLINAVFEANIPVAPGKSDINHEIHPEDNDYLIVHEASGFGPEDGQNLRAIQDFISYQTDPSCSDAEKLHAVWICIPTFDAINENIGVGIEEILGMKQVPIVVAFTKFDQAAAIEGGSFVRTDARTRIEQSCRSLFRRELGDVPAEIVSVRSPFRDLLDNLVITTDGFITGSRTDSANSSQPSAQRTEPLIAPVPLAWSVASRVNRDIFIQASIEIGRSRYWRRLWSSVDFTGQPFKDCLDVIHEDIVATWNLKDRTTCLSGTEFKKKMSHNLKDLVGSFSGAPSSDGSVDWISDVYRGSQQNVRCVMAYIVDLTVILDDIFRTAGNSVSANDVQSAMNRHASPRRRDRIHCDIRSFVTETFATRFKAPQRDLVLEKIVELIRQYCTPSSEGKSYGM